MTARRLIVEEVGREVEHVGEERRHGVPVDLAVPLFLLAEQSPVIGVAEDRPERIDVGQDRAAGLDDQGRRRDEKIRGAALVRLSGDRRACGRLLRA